MMRSASKDTKGNMRHGLISLLTVVVVLSLSTAAVLAVSTAHAMHALADRQASMTAQGYDAERSAQAALAKVDEILAQTRADGLLQAGAVQRLERAMNSLLAEVCEDGVSATYGLQNNVLTCTFSTTGGRMLATQVAIKTDATYDVVSWRLTAVPEEVNTGDTLWTGSAAGE